MAMPCAETFLTRKYVKIEAFYNLLLISELVVSVALIVSPLCLKGMLLRRKSISFASRKGTFCSVKPLNFSRKNGGLGLYKLCRCNEMLNMCSRNACAVNFCLRFVFRIKENSCPDFLPFSSFCKLLLSIEFFSLYMKYYQCYASKILLLLSVLCN